MSTSPGQEVDRLLPEVQKGNRAALDAMSEIAYKELKRIAAAYLRRESSGHTLQPTALVHELYLRMADWGANFDNKSRAHFLSIAATLMRQILVQHARRRYAAKRGGRQHKVTLEETLLVSADGSPELVALDDALTDLAKTEPRKSRVIELRYFGGLSDAEIAEVLEISVTTVGREIRMGLALLYRGLEGEADAAQAGE